MAVDYAGPLFGFWLPIAGSTPMSDWTLQGWHLAERNQQFIVIALGESILALGATFSELDTTAIVFVAFIIGFLVPASLWRLYFVRYA